MKISGFTIVRHGVQYDYPYLESIRSLLPLVDELIINVGMGQDSTYSQLRTFASVEGGGKIHLFESDWQLDHPEKKKGGIILSEQTNLALEKCNSDWCVYLQADEVIHEADIPRIRTAIAMHDQNPAVEGLLFDYLHFYGSFDVIQHSRSTYRREVRVIRKSSGAESKGDAQSFRKKDGSKLNVAHSHARIFHYGWVRPPEKMKEKTYFFDQMYHGSPTQDQQRTQTPHTGDNYRYKKIWGLRHYSGTHPSAMQQRIKNKGWHWDLENSPWILGWEDFKKIPLDMIERLTGHRLFEYRSYILSK